MGKKVSTDKYLQILDYLSELEISIRSSFIIGYPGENQESIANTINFLNKLPTKRNAAFYVGFAPFILLPLSPIYYESERSPFKLRGYLIDWQHEHMSFSDIPNHLRDIFLSVNDEILFAYTADPIDINLPNPFTKELKVTRQKYQKGIIQGSSNKDLNNLKSDLEVAIDKLQSAI
jgi:radical SAM superfamily enzyme YgiQ (UPF0313 family)